MSVALQMRVGLSEQRGMLGYRISFKMGTGIPKGETPGGDESAPHLNDWNTTSFLHQRTIELISTFSSMYCEASANVSLPPQLSEHNSSSEMVTVGGHSKMVSDLTRGIFQVQLACHLEGWSVQNTVHRNLLFGPVEGLSAY
ncbi:unnamed protein product [Boreogadus saida]